MMVPRDTADGPDSENGLETCFVNRSANKPQPDRPILEWCCVPDKLDPHLAPSPRTIQQRVATV